MTIRVSVPEPCKPHHQKAELRIMLANCHINFNEAFDNRGLSIACAGSLINMQQAHPGWLFLLSRFKLLITFLLTASFLP